MNSQRFVQASVVVLLFGSALCAVQPASASFTFVDLSYEGAEHLQIFGTNNRGLVVATAHFADGSSVPFVYNPKKQTSTELPPLPGCHLSAMAISDSGVITGGCETAPILVEGFILKHGTYTRFAYPDFERTFPRAISSTGLVTGYAEDDDTGALVGFIYDPKLGTFTDIGVPETSLIVLQIIAQGINGRGHVVGNVILMEPDWSAVYFYGFVREPSGAMTLFQVNDRPTRARGITDSGVIVGYTDVNGSQVGYVGALEHLGGFQSMTDAEYFSVPFTGAAGTYPEAIDNSGGVVGGWTDEFYYHHGFIATPVPKGRQ
jgi:hypothetical protein